MVVMTIIITLIVTHAKQEPTVLMDLIATTAQQECTTRIMVKRHALNVHLENTIPILDR